MGMAPGGFGGEGFCPVSSPSLAKNPSSSLVQATATATAHQFCRARLGMRWSPPSPRHVTLGGQLASLLWPLAVTSLLLWNCGQGQQRDERQGRHVAFCMSVAPAFWRLLSTPAPMTQGMWVWMPRAPCAHLGLVPEPPARQVPWPSGSWGAGIISKL